ncbi:hypothetical protein BpHYR1_013897 [Brachionus plicatilis]|uniref:Uncharacterized protein n=1 Tax=Brachionus plicatilis TaxID=10195 RepID=A0A3M7RJ70_BRAPC|nr:hypothetical protein BpHYR1_013897 [Brachionus plicatilis]
MKGLYFHESIRYLKLTTNKFDNFFPMKYNNSEFDSLPKFILYICLLRRSKIFNCEAGSEMKASKRNIVVFDSSSSSYYSKIMINFKLRKCIYKSFLEIEKQLRFLEKKNYLFTSSRLVEYKKFVIKFFFTSESSIKIGKIEEIFSGSARKFSTTVSAIKARLANKSRNPFIIHSAFDTGTLRANFIAPKSIKAKCSK